MKCKYCGEDMKIEHILWGYFMKCINENCVLNRYYDTEDEATRALEES